MNAVAEEKRALRRQFRVLRDAIPPAERELASGRIMRELMQLDLFREAEAILTYVSVGSEVSTVAFLQACFSLGKPVAAPVCEAGNALRFYYIDSLSELQTGRYGIPEPLTDACAPVSGFDGTLCLVPGLAFDRSGCRLGYGGGYYDRFLACFPGRAVGLCYDACLTDRLPKNEFDRTLGMILTESGSILCRE